MSCKQETYKRLGDYIREVDVRNTDSKISKLVGLTIAKSFIPSVANTIGTDLSKYKIIKENQFACSLMQVSRDGKMPVAIYKGEDAIMSPAYPVFEVYKEGLLPYYLQMWFSRPEFDREAVFFAVGGVRGSLEWNDFMDMKLPIPDPEEQQRIVDQYNAIQKRIENNKKTIAKLEEAIQAIYRKSFVEDIDPENLPEDWHMGTFGEVASFNEGEKVSKQIIRYFDTSSVTKNVFTSATILDKSKDEVPSRAQRPVQSGDIIYSTVRPNLCHYGIIIDEDCSDIVVSTGFAVIRSSNNDVSTLLLYCWLTDENVTTELQQLADMSKATYPSIVVDDIKSIKIPMPNNWDYYKDSLKNLDVLYKHVHNLLTENSKLESLRDLYLNNI
ncbi:MAG: restriction endonuclease subunit S [Segatella copri]